MKFSTSKKIPAVLSLLSIGLLAACGGGGGGAGTPSPTNTSAITSSNAQTVAAQAMNGSTAINGGAASGSALAAGVSITGTDIVRTGIVRAALQQLYNGLDVAPPANLPVGITASNSGNCPNGGTISVTATFADSHTVSNGDNMSITATNCSDNDGKKLNGTLTIAFSKLSGTIGSANAWSANLALGFTNFTVEENGEISGANGDMNLGYSQTNSQNSTASISGRSMRNTLVRSATTALDETLSGYSLNGTASATLYTQSVGFTFTDNRAAALTSYDLKTLAPFKQTSSSTYPYEGSVIITAGNGSKATITAIDSTNVRIDVDTNGDGVTDQTINTTWAALN